MKGREVRDRVVYSVKWLIANTLYWSGVLSALRRTRLRGRIVVLAYHRVLPASTVTWSHPGIVVTPGTFERHLVTLRRHFRLLAWPDFEQAVAGETMAGGDGCLVTFDDGWDDTAAVAAPLLAEHGVPAVLFLATGFIGTAATFWQERMGELLESAARRGASDAAFDARVREYLDGAGLGELVAAYAACDRPLLVAGIRALKARPSFSPDPVIAALETMLGCAGAPAHDRFMSWDDVTRVAALPGITIGSHGHRHRAMPRMSAEDLDDDLRRSRQVLEAVTGRRVAAVSYPNGDWNPDVASHARAAGYVAAFTMDHGSIERGAPALSLRRINVHEDMTRSSAMFLARVVGVL